MPTAQTKKGELFSRNYLRPTDNFDDSKNFRMRLSGYVDELGFDAQSAYVRALKRELAVTLPIAYAPSSIEEFLSTSTIHQVLDAITVLFRVLGERFGDPHAFHCLAFVKRALEEEALNYQIDDLGGMHYRVDAAFEATYQSTLSVLSDPAYKAVRTAFEKAEQELLICPPDTKDALQDLFEAAETLVKILLNAGKSLDANLVGKELRSYVDRFYATADAHTRGFAAQMLEAFGKWVDASHRYRHGPQSDQPHAPPLDLAVLHFSVGASFIRWLASIR